MTGLCLTLVGCPTSPSTPPQDSRAATTASATAREFELTRTATLLGDDFKPAGCVAKETRGRVTGSAPYPKRSDGSLVRDPDDGGPLSALFSVTFDQGGECDAQRRWTAGTPYWVSPHAGRILNPITGPSLQLHKIQSEGSGCPDASSVKLVGTSSGNALALFFVGLALLGPDAPGSANCTVTLQAEIAKGTQLRSSHAISSALAALGSTAGVNLVSKIDINGARQQSQSSPHGPIDETVALELTVPITHPSACEVAQPLTLTYQIDVERNGVWAEADEVNAGVLDLTFELAACP